MRIQSKYITGTVLLIVISGWLFVEIHDCAILTSLSKNRCDSTSPPDHLAQKSTQSIQSEEDTHQGKSERPGRVHYILSRKEYDNYVDGIFGLFLNAFGIPLQSEMTVDETLDLLSSEEMFREDLPPGLAAEHFDIQQLYRDLLQEKNKWDYYQQVQYEGILEDRIEPVMVNSRGLNLAVKDNLDYFLELEKALKLHNRLVRDVRSFHDEVQYQKKQFNDYKPYQLYDLKLQLGPFARESAIADALQHALSSIGTGIYQEEASRVIDRMVEEFTKPVRNLRDTAKAPSDTHYNFDIYVVYGTKLLNYTKTLTEQSSVPLSPSIFIELNHFNRKLIQSLYDLKNSELARKNSTQHLILKEFEQDLY